MLGYPTVDDKGNVTTRRSYENFEKTVSKKLKDLWKDNNAIEQKWIIIKSGIC